MSHEQGRQLTRRVGRRQPPILAGSVRPVFCTRCISLIAADGLTSKRFGCLPDRAARFHRAQSDAAGPGTRVLS